MRRLAVICVILDDPDNSQKEFNDVVSSYKSIVLSRTGMPFEEGIAAISLMVRGSLDDINAFTGRIGAIQNVQVKTAISKYEFED